LDEIDKRLMRDKYTSAGPGSLFAAGFTSSGGDPNRDPPIVTATPVDDDRPVDREAVVRDAEVALDRYHPETLDPDNIRIAGLEDLQSRLIEVERNLEETRRLYRQEQTDHAETKRIAEDTERVYKIDLERITRLTEELEDERHEREKAERERDNRPTRDEYRTLEIRAEDAERERNDRPTRDEYRTLERRANELEREKGNLERRVEELQQRDVVPKADFDALNEGIRRLEGEAERLRGDYNSLSRENAQLQTDYDQALRENQNLERQLRALRGRARPQGDYLSGLRNDPLYDDVIDAADADQYKLALVRLGAISYSNPNGNFNGRRQAAAGLWNRVQLNQKWTVFGKRDVWGSLRGLTKGYRNNELLNMDYVKVARKINELLDK
jgi:hypothetical protein